MSSTARSTNTFKGYSNNNNTSYTMTKIIYAHIRHDQIPKNTQNSVQSNVYERILNLTFD